jgi:hypothetical protein
VSGASLSPPISAVVDEHLAAEVREEELLGADRRTVLDDFRIVGMKADRLWKN